MEWFDILGATFGFLGSVIFAAGLLKPSDQIRDENSTYWGANPFTLNAEMSSQPVFIIAFLLLVTGFSLSLGGKLATVISPDAHEVLTGALVSLSIALSGYLMTALLYVRKIVAHRKKKAAHTMHIFNRAARSYKRDMQAIAGNDSANFENTKETQLTDLREKVKKIPEPEDEKARELIRDLKPVNSPEDFIQVVDSYLSDD